MAGDSETYLRELVRQLPEELEGWRKAEVMAGGVDTRDLESRSMGSRLVRGLYFIGEVVDVTGWLGGASGGLRALRGLPA